LRLAEFSKVQARADERILLEETNTVTAREVLAELIALLEDYAPSWYTEEHHLRALAALQGPGNPSYAAKSRVRSVHA
jgi:hypothetical protein